MKKTFYLVSFPRSGNTWVRFMIANLYNNIKQSFPGVDFHNIHQIIPELTPRGVPTPAFDDLPTVVKTHDAFDESFEYTVLVLRNPFDSLYSYHDYLNRNKGIQISLADTVSHEKYGISAVVAHADSFIQKCPNLLLLTYEHLLAQPEKELSRICDFIGFESDRDGIAKAVAQSSFDNMSNIESSKGRKFGNRDFKFVRQGQSGEGARAIAADQEIHRFMLTEMKKSPVLYLLYG